MAKMMDLSTFVKAHRAMVDLLSEYGVDRAGIDAAMDILIEHGEGEYAQGWNDATNKIAEG